MLKGGGVAFSSAEREQNTMEAPASRTFYSRVHRLRRDLCTSCWRYLTTYRPLIDKMLEGAFKGQRTAVAPI